MTPVPSRPVPMTPMPSTPTLSIVVVLYNSADELEACLRSVRPAVESGWAELILVDNASPDHSVAIAREALPNAALITLAQNRGFAGGVNAALPAAKGPYVLLLNPDVRVPEAGLAKLVEWMDLHPQIGVATPDIQRSGGGGTESPAQALPSIWRLLLEASRVHKLLPPRLRSRLLLGAYWRSGDETDVGWVPGTAMCIRRDAITRAGALCERLFMYGEDIEFCWRVRRAGYRIGVCAGQRFIHQTSASAKRSWGDEEKERRIASGRHDACRLMYGAGHARTIAAVMALTLGIEGCAPSRSRSQRAAIRTAAQRWLQLACAGSDGGSLGGA